MTANFDAFTRAVVADFTPRLTRLGGQFADLGAGLARLQGVFDEFAALSPSRLTRREKKAAAREAYEQRRFDRLVGDPSYDLRHSGPNREQGWGTVAYAGFAPRPWKVHGRIHRRSR